MLFAQGAGETSESKEENIIARRFYIVSSGGEENRNQTWKRGKRGNEEEKKIENTEESPGLVASFRVLKKILLRLGGNSISLMHRALQNTAFISSFPGNEMKRTCTCATRRDAIFHAETSTAKCHRERGNKGFSSQWVERFASNRQPPDSFLFVFDVHFVVVNCFA